MIDRIRTALESAAKELGIDVDRAQLDRPRQAGHGDLSTNLPLVVSQQVRLAPLELAQAIADQLVFDPAMVAKVDVAPPGFINFSFGDPFLQSHLRTILKEGSRYGRSSQGKGRSALVEFVSANPTGPLTVGHGRGAVVGDVVSNILTWNGYRVEREYYYNDAGRQMRILGESLRARYLEVLGKESSFPEEGYQGEYLVTIAQHLAEEHGETLLTVEDIQPFTEAAEQTIFDDIRATLTLLGITFDHYFNEKSLYDSGAMEQVLTVLRTKDLAYEMDGAVWMRGTTLGRDADRVLMKRTGEPTYRLPDIAYHADKLERKFDLTVDIFGADHQETYPDVLAGLKGLGYDTDRIRVLIHQFVTILKGGEQIKMSTRKATYVTLEELITEVGRDVTRYFFIMRTMGSHLNFDLDLAKKASDENPVYYLQYAHARMVNIEKHGQAFGHRVAPASAALELLTLPEERSLLITLWWFPQLIEQLQKTLEPQAMTVYLQELATAFHKYYAIAKVVTDDDATTGARLVLNAACRQTLANGLAVLGVSAPERM